jgi:hypothetical protein
MFELKKGNVMRILLFALLVSGTMIAHAELGDAKDSPGVSNLLPAAQGQMSRQPACVVSCYAQNPGYQFQCSTAANAQECVDLHQSAGCLWACE